MADTGIFATTAEVMRKCGAYASSTSNVEAYINDFMTQAESFINVWTGYNWSDAYSGLNVDVKGILKECASNLAAMYVINYDLAGWVVLGEPQTMLNLLSDRVQQCLTLLKEDVKKKFIQNA